MFDLPFKNFNYNISNLIENFLVAVQAHIFYEDILNEIINKTNNIPIKFDLYISTDTAQKKEFIKKYIDRYSKANNFYIQITENKGRDILPFLIQMREIFININVYVIYILKNHLLIQNLGKIGVFIFLIIYSEQLKSFPKF